MKWATGATTSKVATLFKLVPEGDRGDEPSAVPFLLHEILDGVQRNVSNRDEDSPSSYLVARTPGSQHRVQSPSWSKVVPPQFGQTISASDGMGSTE